MDNSRGNTSARNRENVVLLPKTKEYYQVQLTRLLEKEAYVQAQELLRFLLSCQTEDEADRGEWESLLQWLDDHLESMSTVEAEDEAVSEAELTSQYLNEKAARDERFVRQLLGALYDDSGLEQKLLALEQLTHLKSPENLSEIVANWLEAQPQHPLVQFKALQLLKQRGLDREVHIKRGDSVLHCSVQETPLSQEEFPQAVNEVANRVREVCEVMNPSLAYFAEQAWSQFVAAVYGGSMYEQLRNAADEDISVWAAALHQAAVNAMAGDARPVEVRSYYDVNEQKVFQWEQVYRAIIETFHAL
ncbi:hypothetical protein XYCOK13_30370 [Xylanibacillus composti]|uniref:Uncharacterized protein n=1 Tax=Xylanibacillus composti TaxID=1572762 RepID=A0A8J4H3C6_9BACL|nr:hypothetical protein [Xylanibacillus composti]GIQ70213.1 hypothetical protein XYCOK13_30370 [Xylanibacillus composti]